MQPSAVLFQLTLFTAPSGAGMSQKENANPLRKRMKEDMHRRAFHLFQIATVQSSTHCIYALLGVIHHLNTASAETGIGEKFATESLSKPLFTKRAVNHAPVSWHHPLVLLCYLRSPKHQILLPLFVSEIPLKLWQFFACDVCLSISCCSKTDATPN